MVVFRKNENQFTSRPPAKALLGVFSKDTQSHQKDICSTMFTAALFIIARALKQARCPSPEEWIKKMWHIYTMEYYSERKKKQ